MVRIKKGSQERVVARGAYKNYYEGMGWVIIGEPPKATNHETSKDAADDVSDEEWDDALAEEDEEPSKPLSEMNRAELEAMAERLGVSLAGLSNNKQIREAIRAAM